MKTIHRFTFPARSNHAALEVTPEFDLSVQVGNLVEFEAIPEVNWVITQKKFKVLFDNTIEYVDYQTDIAK
ncbi:hypothetical protein [Pseudomonas sp. NPDC086278]|uniref:hypothetical protein n=1 Tax=Pseudomonas sp. NPDC086278 TaxID=3390646 RepID=UPI003D06AD76